MTTESTPPAGEDVGPKKGRKLWRRLRWALLALVLPPTLYLGAAEVAMRIPVNAGADPMDGTIPVYFCEGGPHVDVWVPVMNPIRDWTEVLPAGFAVQRGGYLSFGWGDRGFYTEVPEWKDLKASVALKGALLPTPAAMRVVSLSASPTQGERVHLLMLDEEGYGDLVQYIDASFERAADGALVPIDFAGYGQGIEDRFFEATGSYHLLRTCNVWTNGAVKASGKRAALWAPLTRGIRHQLPANSGSSGG